MTVNDTHPIEAVKKITALHSDAELEFSLYEYQPQSILDARQTFTLKASELTNKKIDLIIENLSPVQELAIHSKVRIGKKILHIPMIDFRVSQVEISKYLSKIEHTVSQKIYKEMLFYNSGRSCHAYSLKLITSKEWIDYMGRLLLISLPTDEQIIDTRWVGHRLMAGYTSLRWSNNTSTYLGTPQLCKI